MTDEMEGTGEPVRRGGRGTPVRNTSAPESVAAQQKRLEREREVRESDLRFLMGRPEFRRFVWKLVGDAGVFRRPRVLNAEGYVLHGRAEIGLEVWRELTQVTPAALIEMMQAAMNEEKA